MSTTEGDASDQRDAILMRELVHEFATPLYRYAFRLTGQASDAEDLVQQTFLTAQGRLNELRNRERPSAWLYAILRHTWCHACRRARIHERALQSLQNEALRTTTGESEVDSEQLQRSLAELPPEFRLVILMFYFEDLSYQEIASQLDLPIGTVMSRLSRAKKFLRSRLMPAEPSESCRPKDRAKVEAPRMTPEIAYPLKLPATLPSHAL